MAEAIDHAEPVIRWESTRLWLCSSNAGKLRDFAVAARQIGETRISIAPLPTLAQIRPPDETGKTFEENAILKARYYSGFAQEPVLADDSGLEVETLHSAPGVHSARYAGLGASDAENNDLLLRNLESCDNRGARFVCVLAVAQRGEVLLTVHGSVEGVILREAQGTGGFGYDPLFFCAPLQRSFGELPPEEKLLVSHRGVALRKLLQQLPSVLSGGN